MAIMPQPQQQQQQQQPHTKRLSNKSSSSSSLQHQQQLGKPPASQQASNCLTISEQLLTYCRQLDDHRKRCELCGRYAEASAAAARIKELQGSEGTRLKGLLAATQSQELALLQQRFETEGLEFASECRAQVGEFDAGVKGQLTALKQAHEVQQTDLLLRCELQRPNRPQHSSAILNSRKIEEALVKQGEYRRAHEVKVTTDELYHAELAAAQDAWELGVELQRGKLIAKQQGELASFLTRAQRGRNELELRRVDEVDRRTNRFRAQVQELDAMHRVEALHLQAYLDSSSACTRPFVPLRDSKFARKRQLQLGLP